MKRYLQEAVRWTVIVACLAFAGGMLILSWPWKFSVKDGFEATMLSIMLCLEAFFIVPPLAIAYFCFRRQYRKLYLVVGAVGVVVIFFGLQVLPIPIDFRQVRPQDMTAGQDFMMLAWLFYAIFVPIYAAAGFYRLCRWLAFRNSEAASRPKAKTRPTRWLVWLGAACLLLPSPVIMTVHLNRMMAAPPGKQLQPTDIGNEMSLVGGLAMLGSVLMFLGFVNRKPMRDAMKSDEPLPARIHNLAEVSVNRGGEKRSE